MAMNGAFLFAFALALAAAERDPVLAPAGALLDRNEFAGAAALLEPAAAAPSRDAEVYLMLAVARVNLRQPQQAVDSCERGLRAAPGSARLENYCASLFRDVVPAAESVPRLERALAACPASGVLEKALGEALLAAAPNDPRIEALLSRAVAKLPEDPGVHYSYGQWACLHEKPALCVTSMRNTLALSEPSNCRARLGAETFIAMAEESQGHFDAAKHAYLAALEADRKLAPFNPEPAFQYVKFLQSRSEDEAAGALVEEILTRAPRFAPARFERAKTLFRRGQAEEAAGEAEAALQNSTGDKTELRAVHTFLVKAYSVLDREDDAKRHQTWVEANR